MDDDDSGEVDFEEFFGWYKDSKKDAGTGGGMFFSFTQKGHLTRLRTKLEASQAHGRPMFRGSAGYKELEDRDRKKGGARTAKAMAAGRDKRGFVVRQAFKSIDADGSGQLDRDEVCRGAWARVTIGQCRHSTRQAFKKHGAPSDIFPNKMSTGGAIDRVARDRRDRPRRGPGDAGHGCRRCVCVYN